MSVRVGVVGGDVEAEADETYEPPWKAQKTGERTPTQPPVPPPPPAREEKWVAEEWVAVDDMRAEEWAAFEWTPRAWCKVLAEHGVDVDATQELFLLAQVDKVAAAKVIGKFLKKRSDNVVIRKPSAWIHANVKAANQELGYW